MRSAGYNNGHTISPRSASSTLFFVKKYLLYNISIYNPVPPDIVDSESSGDIMVTEGQNATLRFVTIQIDNIIDH